MASESRRAIRPGVYLVSFLLCAVTVFASHLRLLRLPYYWDETGQFIPAALDILHGNAWIPKSTVPNIHPPAVMAYLAAIWRVAGYHPESTRCAMLLLAACGLFAAFLLVMELLRDEPLGRAIFAAVLLAVSPLFFAQGMLAQLDAPAMLFTALAALFFLQDRIRLSAALCVVLVLVKETGIIVPLVCGLWLAHERRWRDAANFAAPLAALLAWILVLAAHTGHWTGNPEFARFNLYYPLHPARVLVTLLRRLYFLFVANCHWAGTAAIGLAWRRTRLFRSRSWKVAGLLASAHLVAFTLLGGAVLARYLLPAMPILYAAMAAGLSTLGRFPKLVCSSLLVAGLAAGNIVNPLYPFPFEENLAFTDFLKLQSEASSYLEARYPRARIDTLWPMTAELSYPEFGFVHRSLAVRLVENLAPTTVDSIDWSAIQVLVIFPRNYAPPLDLTRYATVRRLLKSLHSVIPDASRDDWRARAPFPLSARFERGGQWVDIYVNPVSSR